jgi:hypothetical protein
MHGSSWTQKNEFASAVKMALPMCWYQFRRMRRLAIRWSGRVMDKAPSSNVDVRAAQLNRAADKGR